MKKVILTMCLAGALLATSCKKEATDATKKVEATAKEATKAAKTALEGVTIHEFKNSNVEAYLQSYAAYAKNYIDAKGDVIKNTELAKKGVELAAKEKAIFATLDTEGTKKFNSVLNTIQSKMAITK